MPKLHYRVVQHDGGWAYRSNDGFSEPFRDRAAALAAARRVAKEQRVPGDTTHIEFQDADGKWHRIVGGRRPAGRRRGVLTSPRFEGATGRYDGPNHGMGLMKSSSPCAVGSGGP